MEKSVTLKLTSTMVDDIEMVLLHKREGATFNSVVLDAVEKGLYDFIYRYNRNKKKWQETKARDERLAQLEEQISRMKLEKEMREKGVSS
jgi:hypothetical protein